MQRGLSCNDGRAPSLCRGELLCPLQQEREAGNVLLRREDRAADAGNVGWTRESGTRRRAGNRAGAGRHPLPALHHLPTSHLLDDLGKYVVTRPVRGSHTLPHPPSSSAALPGGGLLKEGGIPGIHGRLDLHGRYAHEQA